MFGKASGAPVDLADPGSGGFRIDGIDAGDRSGFSVSGTGDLNGDGLDDLIIGASKVANQAGESFVVFAGKSYVVFGKADSATVELSALGSQGFTINGIDADDRNLLFAVAEASRQRDTPHDHLSSSPPCCRDPCGTQQLTRVFVYAGSDARGHR